MYKEKLFSLWSYPYDPMKYAIKTDNISAVTHIILVGKTPFAEKAADIFHKKGYNVAFLDKYETSVKGDIPVWNLPKSIAKSQLFIHCSRPHMATYIEMLEGFEQQITYQQLLIENDDFDSAPYAYTHEKITAQIRHTIEHKSDYVELMNELQDEESQELLARILLFRLTFDYRLHKNIKSKYTHYFEKDIFSLSNHEIFIDGGGYTGDTLKDFLTECNGKFNEYYLFEPEEILLQQAKNISNSPAIHYVRAGLYNQTGNLEFNIGEGSGNGAICGGWGVFVPVIQLDEFIHTPVTFVKLDVEGSELEALQGAKKLITNYQPKMAICVYHKYGDIIELYRYVRTLGKYKFFLRAQYDNVDTELILYAIPNKKN